MKKYYFSIDRLIDFDTNTLIDGYNTLLPDCTVYTENEFGKIFTSLSGGDDLIKNKVLELFETVDTILVTDENDNVEDWFAKIPLEFMKNGVQDRIYTITDTQSVFSDLYNAVSPSEFFEAFSNKLHAVALDNSIDKQKALMDLYSFVEDCKKIKAIDNSKFVLQLYAALYLSKNEKLYDFDMSKAEIKIKKLEMEYPYLRFFFILTYHIRQMRLLSISSKDTLTQLIAAQKQMTDIMRLEAIFLK